MPFFDVDKIEFGIWTHECGFDYQRKPDGSMAVGEADERLCDWAKAKISPAAVTSKKPSLVEGFVLGPELYVQLCVQSWTWERLSLGT